MSRAEWEMHDIRSNTSGTYYVLTCRTAGQMEACVTVKFTRFNTAACLTCHSITCQHARFVEEYRLQHGAEHVA
jgi:hypothetical protein